MFTWKYSDVAERQIQYRDKFFSIRLMRFNNENPFCVQCETERGDIYRQGGEKNTIFLPWTAVFRCYEIREITVINFQRRSFRCAQRNLLMQIRRSYNAWMKMILIDDPRERFVSFSPTSSDCRYQITALNFHVLTSGLRNFHTPLLL